MREIVDHIANPVNRELKITVIDEPGQGGANHSYEIRGFDLRNNQAPIIGHALTGVLPIVFQNGPIKEFGVNGVTQEALLAIVIDRLRSFQAGPFSCRDNAIALTHCEEALLWLQKRTHDRMRRGVEGTNQK